MKTIIFSTDPKIIEDYQKQGEVIVAKDPIKTLKAMKKIGNKDEYRVVGEDKYVEFSRQLGYNKPMEVKEEPVKEEPKEPSIQTISKLTALYEQQLKEKDKELQTKTEEFSKRIESLKKEHDNKIAELEKEKVLIKKAIKQAIHGTN